LITPQEGVNFMKQAVKKSLFWMPRILGILFAVFVSIFAFDVFDEGYGFWKTILALLIHLIPTGLILLALIIAWRWEWVGGILFIALGIWYIIAFWGRFILISYIMISGPLFLIAILFLVNWLYRRDLRKVT